MNIVNNKLRFNKEDIVTFGEIANNIENIEVTEDARGNFVVNIFGDIKTLAGHKYFKAAVWKTTAYGSRLSRTFKKTGTPITMIQ